HRARNILDAHAERGGAAALDAHAELRLVHLETHADVPQIVHAANLVRQVLRRLVERVQVLVLQDQLKGRIAEIYFDGLGLVGYGKTALYLHEKSLGHAAGAVNDLLHRALPLALVLETHEDHAEIRLAGTGKRRRHHRAERFHFRHGGDDFLGLLQLTIGEFARRAVWGEHHAEHPARVFQRPEVRLQ